MPPITTKNIVLVGDSIVYGAWDRGGGWGDRLRRSLMGHTMDSNYTEYYWVYNLGIPGDTTDDLFRRFDAECAAREPHILIFAIGINDSARMVGVSEARVPMARFRENAAALLAKAKERAPDVLCVGLTPVDETRTSPFNNECYFSNAAIQEYDKHIREVCRKKDIPVMSVWDAINPATDLADGLHLNDSGHEKIHVLMRDVILNINKLPERQSNRRT